jgi:hypothetical protein
MYKNKNEGITEMKINKLRVPVKNNSTLRILYFTILLSCLMLMTSVTFAANRTASDILDHAVNLSGIPQSQSYESQNGGLVFSPTEKPVAENKAKSVTEKPNEVAKAKKSDKANDNEVIASLNTVS